MKRTVVMRANYGDHIGSLMHAAMETLPSGLESLLAEASAYAPTLIHADIHLDNIIFQSPHDGAMGAVLLDWQSVSAGPAAYDVVRLLTGALRGAAHQSAMADLIDAYLGLRSAFGAPITDVA